MEERREKGQSAVELALLLPLLMLILLGCLDLGRVYSSWIAVTNGSREGARWAARHAYQVEEDLQREAKWDMTVDGLQADGIEVEPSFPLGVHVGAPVRVTASYSVPLLTSLLFGGRPVTVRATTQMMIIYDGQQF